MKVLFMAWTIYDSRINEFCKDYTGGSIVIRNICEYVGRKAEAFLFVGRIKLPELQLGNFRIVDTESEPEIVDEGMDANERHLRTMTNAFSNALEKIKPDIVNFHGIGVLVQRCVHVCIEKNIPYVYTEHLFIPRNKEFGRYDNNIEWEKQLYSIPDIQMITVSTGMKNKIMKDFPFLSSDKIKVIENGTDFVAEIRESNLSNEYHLNGNKVLLCVGSVTERKNQTELIRTFQLLPDTVKENVKIIFLGTDRMQGKLQEEIQRAGLEDRLIYAGAVSSEEMKKYYTIADGLIMPSMAEGLSIAALEMIAYGKPVIMFADSECAEDLNDEKVVCLAEKRSDKCLAEAIMKWYDINWDKGYITDYSGYFCMERVAEDYLECYKRILSSWGKSNA